MSDDLRRCVRAVLIGAACVGALDVSLGEASRRLFFAQRSGKFYRINTAMESASEDVVVFGSSHAASHYVPEVFTEHLGMSCYNAGVLGQQILFHRVLESILLSRTTPKVIILDVDPSTLYESKDAYDRLAELKPFYFRHPEIIGPVLYSRSRLEKLYLWSRLYQYNSTIVHVIRYAVAPQPDWNGYRPTYGEMPAPTAEQERDEIGASRRFRANRNLDPVMVEALRQFGAEARRHNVSVFYTVSPGALPDDLDGNRSLRKVRELAMEGGVPLFIFRNHPGFLRQYALFADSGHLNDTGARRYSALVADTIKRELSPGAF